MKVTKEHRFGFYFCVDTYRVLSQLLREIFHVNNIIYQATLPITHIESFWLNNDSDKCVPVRYF